MVRYEAAALVPNATGCQTGTRALGLAIKNTWSDLQSLTNVYGCFNHRRIAGSTAYSLHAEGRALDVGVPSQAKRMGWALSCELSAHRQAYGVQRIIWDGHIWSIEHADAWRELQPQTKDRHYDHIHIEQYWSAALKPATVQSTYEQLLRAARTGVV
jgi:hypothetical protein